MVYQVIRFSAHDHDNEFVEETFYNRQEAKDFIQELKDETPSRILEITGWYILER